MIKALYYYYWLVRTKNLRRYFPKYKIMSIEETINTIVSNKMSLSRFGDGEFRLVIKERDIVFQSLSTGIAERLNEVLNSTLPNHLVALPSSFISVAEFKRDAKIHWLHFINQYGLAISRTILNRNYIFGNAFISRFYIDFVDNSDTLNTVQNLKKIWDNEDLLIVEGFFSRLGVGNDLFDNSKSLKRIICPPKDAFGSYDEIVKVCKKFGKDKLILIALGPTASILAFDLARANFWGVDIGHIDIEYMWMLVGAKSKISVKGRSVAEASSNLDLEIDVKDLEHYNSSIIYTINNDLVG